MRYGLQKNFFCTWISTGSSTIGWKDYSLSTELLLHLCQKSIDLIGVDVLLDAIPVSLVSLCIYANSVHTVWITITYWTWNQIVWFPQLCLFFCRVVLVICPFHFHTNFSIGLLVITKKSLLEFWLEWNELIDQFEKS